MKTPFFVVSSFLALLGLISTGVAADKAAPAAAKASKPANTECPICDGPANPKCNTTYEEVVYAFRSGKCRTEFLAELEASLYHKLGGKAAISAAVDLFYTKVLADKRVNHFFEDVNMARQHNKQKSFLSSVLGSPVPYEGKDMRAAHKHLDLTEAHFGAIAENLQATLTELKIDEETIGKVMTLVASTKDDVLNRPKSEKKG